MERWKIFLESLRTGGGRIFVNLYVLSVAIGIGVLLSYFPPKDGEIAKAAALALVALISGFSTALISSQRGNPPKGNGNGGAE